MKFRILGPLEVVGEAGPVTLPRGRGRALLAILVLHAGEVVSTDRLIDQLWGEARPATAATALHGFVSTLRRRLEPTRASGEAPTVLQTCPGGYVLAVDRAEVDANRFRYLVETATSVPAERRATQLRAALALWRGPALADFTYEPFAQTAISALEELRLTALDRRIEADLELGRHGELVAELETVCVEHPLRERLHGHLMVALYRSGRQADALQTYARVRRTLVDELGIEPGPALRNLEQAILRHDPALDHQRPAAAREPVPERPWLPHGRRTATVMFVDLTVLASPEHDWDPEALRAIVARGYEAVADVIDRHGGTVEAFVGDVVVAVFGVPTAHEDDALRALRAAVDVRRGLAALNEQPGRDQGGRLGARIGINTGEIVVGDAAAGGAATSGGTVKVAARLQQAAADDEVLLSEATRVLVDAAAVVEPADSAVLDGSGVPVIAWKLVDLVAGGRATADVLDTPLVGRTDELAWLQAALDRAIRRHRAVAATVIGDAGIGKSRLSREFAGAIRDRARILTGRCRAYGDGITFSPLRQVVLQAAGERGPDAVSDLLADDPRTALHVLSIIGLAPEAGTAEEVFPAVRRFFEALASQQPLVVILEDLHWAQPTLLDLVEFLSESTRAPMLLLCLARPEFLEIRSTWAQDSNSAVPLVLQALGAEESEELIAGRLAGRVLPPETVTRIRDTAQGNPFFIEQLLAGLRDDREFTIPPSVQALLAARLDRLGPAERDLLRCASPAGIEFSTGALAALIPDEARSFADRHLQTLVSKELLRPVQRTVLGKPGYAFRHVLIQQAAYRSITRQARAELHERFADWLKGEAATGLSQIDEVVGYHLEQAWDQRRQLGVVDEHTDALAQRGGERLAQAGARAYDRYDMAAAANLLSRAKSLLPSCHPQRPPLLRQLSAAHQQTGQLHDADAALAELLDEAPALHDPRVERAIRLERTRLRLFTGPDPTPLAAIQQEAEQVLEASGASPDELAQACHVLALVHLRSGRMADLERVAHRGLDHADRSGNPRDELAARWNLAWAIQAGVTPISDGIRMCEKLAQWRGREHPGVLCELGSLHAMSGQFEQARELTVRGRRLMQEWMHARGPLMFAARSIATVATLDGDYEWAERELRAGLQIGLQMGTREQIAELAALLSRSLARRGAFTEAEQLATLSMEQAPAESISGQALWRAAMARTLVSRGSHHKAVSLAREAVALPPADMLNLRADLLVNLAEILLAAGPPAAAHDAATKAAELYDRKGSRVCAARLPF